MYEKSPGQSTLPCLRELLRDPNGKPIVKVGEWSPGGENAEAKTGVAKTEVVFTVHLATDRGQDNVVRKK